MKDISKEVESIYNDFGNTLIPVSKDFTILSKTGQIIGNCSRHKDIYRVAYPNTGNREVDNRILMHEYGHIYCGHLEGIHEELDSNLSRILRNKDDQLIKLINENCGIDYADKIIDKVISDPYLNHFIHNLAMDMEVNSSILDENDLNKIGEELNQMIYDEYMVLSEGGTKLPSIEELSRLYSKFDLKFVHPSYFGFPSGLTYPDYLVQLILHLDKVMNMLSESINNTTKSRDRLNQQSEKSNGQGDVTGGQNDESQRNKCNDNSYVPKTKEEFEEMMRNATVDNDNCLTDDDPDSQPPSTSSGSMESSGKNGKNSKDKTDKDKSDNGDHGTDSRKDADEKRLNDLGNYASPGGNGRGNEASDSERNYQVNNDPLTMSLEEIIREFRHKVIKRDFTKDMTHKYNRRILGSDSKMLSPTYRQKITRSENPTVAFYVDVSGSMDTSLVDRIITTIRYKMRNIDRSLLYNIISWDTQLCEFYKDINFNSPIPKLRCGGGTDMGRCFDHFKDNFGTNAIMILISDFDDNLAYWNEKESCMTGYSMYGLMYGSDYNEIPDFKNFKVRYCGS